MRVVLLSFLFLAAIAVPTAEAQIVPPPGATPPGMGPPANLFAPPAPGDKHFTRAMDFVVASGTKDLITQYIQKELQIATTMAHRQSDSKDPALWKDVDDTLKKETDDGFVKVMNGTARVYGLHFTDADLDALIAFYNSPVGRKYTALRPQIMSQSRYVVFTWGQALRPDKVAALVDKFERLHKGSKPK